MTTELKTLAIDVLNDDVNETITLNGTTIIIDSSDPNGLVNNVELVRALEKQLLPNKEAFVFEMRQRPTTHQLPRWNEDEEETDPVEYEEVFSCVLSEANGYDHQIAVLSKHESRCLLGAVLCEYYQIDSGKSIMAE